MEESFRSFPPIKVLMGPCVWSPAPSPCRSAGRAHPSLYLAASPGRLCWYLEAAPELQMDHTSLLQSGHRGKVQRRAARFHSSGVSSPYNSNNNGKNTASPRVPEYRYYPSCENVREQIKYSEEPSWHLQPSDHSSPSLPLSCSVAGAANIFKSIVFLILLWEFKVLWKLNHRRVSSHLLPRFTIRFPERARPN